MAVNSLDRVLFVQYHCASSSEFCRIASKILRKLLSDYATCIVGASVQAGAQSAHW
jgi:hypothetical protein